MRKTRFMSLLFLVWSVAFFFVPDFRQAFQIFLPIRWSATGTNDWLVRKWKLSPQGLADAGRRAEQERDARTLAFVALHLDNSQESLREADQAIAIDPGLTWVYGSLIYSGFESKPMPSNLHALATRLENWDPDNAVPYFLEARNLAIQKNMEFLPTREGLDSTAKETEWCQAMQKGFAAAHYDLYVTRRFELERTWLRQNHLDKPDTMLLSLADYPLPNLVQIRAYTLLLVDKYGKEAEDAGQMPKALDYYWTAEHFGDRMHLNGRTLIERLVAVAVLKIVNKRLIPALHKAGQNDPAIALEMRQQQFDQEIASLRGKDPLAQSANYQWAALIINILAVLVVVVGALTLLTVVYTNAKRWVRPQYHGSLFKVLTVAENYMPILLFMTCVGLYLSFYPYAQNFHHYMSAPGEIYDLEPLWYNILPNLVGMPGQTALPIGNPLRPYIWYALAGLILAVLGAIPYYRRAK